MWTYAADTDSIAVGEAVRVITDKGLPVAVFNVDGEFLCTTDTCTHEASSLSDGYIDGDTVECGFHFARFSIRTGAVLCPPAMLPLRHFRSRSRTGSLYRHLIRGVGRGFTIQLRTNSVRVAVIPHHRAPAADSGRRNRRWLWDRTDTVRMTKDDS